jgi:chromate transporter
MLNLAIWFAVHVAFAEVAEQRMFGMRLLIPDPGSVQLASVAITIVALGVLLKTRIGVLTVMAASAVLGTGYYYLTA